MGAKIYKIFDFTDYNMISQIIRKVYRLGNDFPFLIVSKGTKESFTVILILMRMLQPLHDL
jgi:hypothetical protein